MDRLKNFIRNINYLTKHSLWDQREKDIVYLTDKILDDGVYEYGLELPNYKKPHILSCSESLDLILSSNNSFVRTSDGECKYMMGMDQPFQKYEKEVADRLINLIQNKRDDIYVGISRPYYYALNNNDPYHRRNAYDFRLLYNKYIDTNRIYIDSGVTTRVIPTEGRSEINDLHFEKWRNAFKDKKLLIVCGEGILDKLKFDIFEFASEKKFIYGPRINGWDYHEKIIQEVSKESPRQVLIIMILGMGGKAMIPELVDMGYTCWDIGHLAKMYDTYMRDADWGIEARRKFYAPD